MPKAIVQLNYANEHLLAALDDAGVVYGRIAPGNERRDGLDVFTTDRTAGAEMTEHLLSRDPRPTAIFAANDDMAAGVIYEAQERGLRVPDDLSIAGFDDTLLASRIWPGLTTVRQPTREMGETGARFLIDRVTGRRAEAPAPIPTELVVRRSTGPAPGR